MTQKRVLPPLSALRAFEAAARHMSFKLAADEMHVTASAVSHSVAALEEFLDIKLFHRRTRKLLLTDAGVRTSPPSAGRSMRSMRQRGRCRAARTRIS